MPVSLIGQGESSPVVRVSVARPLTRVWTQFIHSLNREDVDHGEEVAAEFFKACCEPSHVFLSTAEQKGTTVAE